jgi:hypothetical protein
MSDALIGALIGAIAAIGGSVVGQLLASRSQSRHRAAEERSRWHQPTVDVLAQLASFLVTDVDDLRKAVGSEWSSVEEVVRRVESLVDGVIRVAYGHPDASVRAQASRLHELMEAFVRSFNQGLGLDGEELVAQANITIEIYAELKNARDGLVKEIHLRSEPG